MPKVYHPRRPVNDELVLRELDRRMAGRGNGVQTAIDLGTDYSHLRSMRAGSEPVTMKVAQGLGFELRWVKK
jgi:hypothetical protein